MAGMNEQLVTRESDVKLELDVTLPIHPLVAVATRRCLDGLAAFLQSDQFDNLRLLVNELVTNSIRHADSALGDDRIRLRVVALREVVRVEVCDSGPGFAPAPGDADPEATSGRGLYLLDRIADRWGVRSDERACVWFELDAA
jgi:anti-sigma regulatory factor (Ser/Thr protein kinase)